MIMNADLLDTAARATKSCCAAVYSSEWARLLLGESFHPGGVALTERLGEMLDLMPGDRVLDVAGGTGTSAVYLARRFGVAVTAIDYSAANVAATQEAARQAGVETLVDAREGDAECLPCADGSFDAVICECAFCTFPNKAAAAAEFARVVRPGGRVGLSDLTRAGPLPADLHTLLAWVACIADAQPTAGYRAYLHDAGLMVQQCEPHDAVLGALVRDIRAKLMGAQLLIALRKIDLPQVDLVQAQSMARRAGDAIAAGTLGYVLMVGTRAVPAEQPCGVDVAET